MRPALLTFDIFGTVLDWRAGLGERDFDRLVDVTVRDLGALAELVERE